MPELGRRTPGSAPHVGFAEETSVLSPLSAAGQQVSQQRLLSRTASEPSAPSRVPKIGTKGMYEVNTGCVIMYAEPSANSHPIGVIRGGNMFYGTPISVGTGLLKKTWVRVLTHDVPPPMLCFTREAGLGVIHPHKPKAGVTNLTLTLGNRVAERGGTINTTDIQFVDTDRQFRVSGSVTSVKFFVGYPSLQADLRFQVWRHVKGTIYRLVNETPAIACPSVGFQTYVLPEPMQVFRNDCVGWAHTGAGMLSYSDGGNAVRWKVGRQGVGASVDFVKGGARTFSYEITFHNASPGHMAYKCSSPSPTCYFDGMGSEDVIWVEYNEQKLTRRREMTRGPSETPEVGFDEMDDPRATGMSTPDIHWQKAAKTMTKKWALNPEASSGRSTYSNFHQSRFSSSTMETWSKSGPGSYVNFGLYGIRSPANDNCGRWRQLGGRELVTSYSAASLTG